MKLGEIKRVPNKPPYQHPNAAPDYFVGHVNLVYDGKRIPLEVAMTPHALNRAVYTALKNREDIPKKKRDALLVRVAKALS